MFCCNWQPNETDHKYLQQGTPNDYLTAFSYIFQQLKLEPYTIGGTIKHELDD